MWMLIPWRAEDAEEVGRKIYNRRKELGLSQDDLADRVGSSRTDVCRYENGSHKMNICTFFQYCEALETDLGALGPERLERKTGRQEEMNVLFSRLGEEDQEMLLQWARRLMKSAG